ncbi:LacI family DNA-binding transcriptional regulator [Bifidobacterium eulemuris]|uniref:LacI family DNA-binding transcriptional regulator n=1 Tax=Bifidobacterium eulemuris TaxID=1765219 RepID=A0A261G3D5_9BIFI|nr:LacI family DNA-binding transcriptional regulator [Bifidobacterium eulemuris]OZG65930.1 periplasmic binding protein and sugar binding domain of the LacI family protein [Bifidobacterium eulemuris]QOL31996.1 LacI family DNA-binding transcriptional regulator [Bifidobacterium eulemuris]
MVVTLKDVAKEADVSPATVSYALRGGQYVSQDTMEKVQRAVKKLGYTTNQTARNLRNGRTGVLEVGVHELDIPYFYSRMAEAMVQRIEKSGYKALVVQTGANVKTVREAVSRLADQPCDGLITNAGGMNSAELKRLGMGKHVVLVDDFSQRLVLDTVIISGEEGLRLSTKHLIERGCTNIAYVGGAYAPLAELDPTNSGDLRKRGYATALSEGGLEYRVENMYDAAWTVEPGREAAWRILKDGMPYDGIVCAADSLALGLIRGFADKGIRVPDAVKVSAFDGISVGNYMVPSLTTVSVDIEDMAAKAVDMLKSRVEGSYDGPPRREEARLELLVRESSR